SGGVRRALGLFLFTSNCAVYLVPAVLDAMQNRELEPRVLYRAPRHDLNLPEDVDGVSWAVLEDPRNLAGPAHVLKRPYMGSGTGDFVLLDRKSFHEIRGFHAVYRVARLGM